METFKDKVKKALSETIGELNNNETREQVKNKITEMVIDLLGPEFAYDIVCDETNNTEETKQNNEFVVSFIPKWEKYKVTIGPRHTTEVE